MYIIISLRIGRVKLDTSTRERFKEIMLMIISFFNFLKNFENCVPARSLRRVASVQITKFLEINITFKKDSGLFINDKVYEQKKECVNYT